MRRMWDFSECVIVIVIVIGPLEHTTTMCDHLAFRHKHADQWEDLERDGRMKSTTSSNLKKLMRQKATK